MKFSTKVEKCGLSPMRKFHPYAVAAKAKGRTIYHLNIGQPDIETPKACFEAVRGFDQAVLEYAPSGGVPELVSAVQKYYADLDMHYTAEEILITTGGSEALQITMNCILDDGDEILIPEPFYPNYNTFVRSAGGVIRPVPTTPDEGYRFADRERIEAQINKNTRAILITNPSNPTGVILTKEEQRLLLGIAKEHDLFLICDEVYREFCYDDKFGVPCMGRFRDIDENLVIIDSVSKRFSACGARVGCVITKNKDLQQAVLKFCQSRLAVATLDQVGAAALYTVDSDFFIRSKEEYRRRRDLRLGDSCRCARVQGSVVALNGDTRCCIFQSIQNSRRGI